MNIKNLISELKRRNVFKVAMAYGIAAWLLAQIANVFEDALRLPDWFDTVIVSALIIGFPMCLIFAWAFEITPEGIKKSKEVNLKESVTDKTGKKINGIIITVLSMAVIFLAVERVFFAEAAFIENQNDATIQTASIAVLPFVNMSSDPENEYFSDGLSEELLNALAKVEDMKVAGRTSSFKFKGQNENISMIAEELGVAYVLEGSVRKFGNKVRITAQLIKADDGYHMWSQTYDRELNDIFAIQEEISRQVLSELRVQLLPEEDRVLDDIPTTDIEAYQAYLKANQLQVNRNYDEIVAAIELYKDAIRLDPTFADAFGQLALAYNSQAYYGNIPREEHLENTRANAENALSINENSAAAHAAMGHYYAETNDFEQAEVSFRRSLELNPSFVDVYNWLGNLYEDMGKVEEQYATYRSAYEVDPLNPLAIYNMARVAADYDLDYQKMNEYLAKNERINPDFVPTYFLKGNLEMTAPFGNQDLAFKYLYQAYELDPEFPRTMSVISFVSMVLDLDGVAEFFMETLRENYRQSIEYKNTVGYYSYLKNDFSLYESEFLSYIEEQDLVPQYAYSYYDMHNYARKTGNIERILPKFRAYAPELFSDTLTTLSVRTVDHVGALIPLLREDGQTEQADLLTELQCEYSARSDEWLAGGKDDPMYANLQSLCAHLQGDAEALYEWLWVMYNDYHDTLRLYGTMKTIKDFDPELYTAEIEELDKTVSEDLKNQREALITEMKASGEWMEEWGEGN